MRVRHERLELLPGRQVGLADQVDGAWRGSSGPGIRPASGFQDEIRDGVSLGGLRCQKSLPMGLEVFTVFLLEIF